MNPILIRLALVAILFGAGAWTGYEWRDGTAAKADLKRAQDAKDEQERLAGIAQDIGQALAKETRGRAGDRVTWRKKLKEAEHAGSLATAECPAQGAAVVRLSADFVRLYDDALLRRKTDDRPATDDRAGGPGAAQSVDPAAVLDNADENGERWASCRSTLRAWQAYARQAGWVK